MTNYDEWLAKHPEDKKLVKKHKTYHLLRELEIERNKE